MERISLLNEILSSDHLFLHKNKKTDISPNLQENINELMKSMTIEYTDIHAHSSEQVPVIIDTLMHSPECTNFASGKNKHTSTK